MNTPTDRVSGLDSRVKDLETCCALETRVTALEMACLQSRMLDKLKKHWKALIPDAVVLIVFAILAGCAAALFSRIAVSAIDAIGTFDVTAHSWKAVALWLGALISTTWAAVAVIALLTSRYRG